MTNHSTTKGRRGWKRRIGEWMVALFVIYLTGCVALYFSQDQMVFPTDYAPPVGEGVVIQGGEAWHQTIEDGGDVEAWFIPPAPEAVTPAPLVVILHGNADLIDRQDPVARQYRAMGFASLIPEFRGYGRSGGKPSQEGIRSDLIVFVDRALKESTVDPSRVVYHGMSLGGGVATDLAAYRKPQALVLQSTFLSIVQMSRRYMVPSFIVKHPYRTDRVLPELGIPVAIFHGTQDEVIPVRQGRRLAEITPGARYMEFDAHHNDFPGQGNDKAYWEAVAVFLRDVKIVPPVR